MTAQIGTCRPAPRPGPNTAAAPWAWPSSSPTCCRNSLLIEGELSTEAEAWIVQPLATLGLGALRERMPGQLSGGEAARAGLAQALVRKPALWLLDEPTGNLDPAMAEEVFGFLLGLHAELRPTTLLVTHNPGLAKRCMRTMRQK
jgi:predicted ABC-type transport system involved in lysophospholipase L1 biosynthesis ATPase subunit